VSHTPGRIAHSTTAVAELLAVSKSYGDRQALVSLDLTLNEGEVVGLLGPNGAGKTTALRILIGQLPPTAGQVRVAGLDVHLHAIEARRCLGYVPDGAPLYSNLSARQHLEIVGQLHGLPESDLRSEITRLLEGLGLLDRAKDPVGGFSRGMRQKVALACALLPRPKLLVLDEPMTGLDAPTTAVLKEVLRAWAQRGGSVLYTSHLLDVVERVCDRMVVLDRGRCIAQGTLDELRGLVGSDGSLEQVFQSLTHAEEPALVARRILGPARS
jgi:ABC-2 type transport system ATP-binding protein